MTQANDDKLSQLAHLAEIQLEIARQQRDSIQGLETAINRGFDGLRGVLDRQAEIATQQQRSIQQFATIFGEMSRAVSDLSQTVRESVESSRRSAQAAEAAAVLAQSNQEAIRDLIAAMREDR